MRKQAVSVLAVVLVLIVIMMTVGCPQPPVDVKEVIVGNKDFTEQRIIGELMKQLLEDRGFKVQLVSGLSSVALRERMEAGNIDISADYTGTTWVVHLNCNHKPGMDNNEIRHLVYREDLGNGLVWLNPIWNNNTYALASWTSFATEHGRKTLSDLAALYREKEGKIKTTISQEFSVRPDGLLALERHYNFHIDESFLQIEPPPGAPWRSLKERQVDVAMVFGTDAAIAEYYWYVYVDDKAFFPPYDLTPYIRREVLDKYPIIDRILDELVATFPGGGEDATPAIVAKSQKIWQELNAKVDIDKMKADEVAHEYLVEHGLIEG